MSVDLELWAVEKEQAYFRAVFGCDLSAAVADGRMARAILGVRNQFSRAACRTFHPGRPPFLNSINASLPDL